MKRADVGEAGAGEALDPPDPSQAEQPAPGGERKQSRTKSRMSCGEVGALVRLQREWRRDRDLLGSKTCRSSDGSQRWCGPRRDFGLPCSGGGDVPGSDRVDVFTDRFRPTGQVAVLPGQREPPSGRWSPRVQGGSLSLSPRGDAGTVAERWQDQMAPDSRLVAGPGSDDVSLSSWR